MNKKCQRFATTRNYLLLLNWLGSRKQHILNPMHIKSDSAPGNGGKLFLFSLANKFRLSSQSLNRTFLPSKLCISFVSLRHHRQFFISVFQTEAERNRKTILLSFHTYLIRLNSRKSHSIASIHRIVIISLPPFLSACPITISFSFSSVQCDNDTSIDSHVSQIKKKHIFLLVRIFCEIFEEKKIEKKIDWKLASTLNTKIINMAPLS